MQQVYKNNHTLVPYHEKFFYTHKPDISSLSTKIFMLVKQNEVQQTLMSNLQLSLLFAVTLNAKNKNTLVNVFFLVTTGSRFALSPLGLHFEKAL